MVENFFALHRTTTGYLQSDVEFYGESNGAKHVTASCCTKNFYTKNLEKVEKIKNIPEYSKKFQHFPTLLDVFFHMKRSKIRYLSTEKTSNNPRNSAYGYMTIDYDVI